MSIRAAWRIIIGFGTALTAATAGAQPAGAPVNGDDPPLATPTAAPTPPGLAGPGATPPATPTAPAVESPAAPPPMAATPSSHDDHAPSSIGYRPGKGLVLSAPPVSLRTFFAIESVASYGHCGGGDGCPPDDIAGWHVRRARAAFATATSCACKTRSRRNRPRTSC